MLHIHSCHLVADDEFVDDIHPIALHLPEHGILAVEECGISGHDVELRGGRVGVICPCHAQSADGVMEAGDDFELNRFIRAAGAVSFGIASLNNPIFNSMKG